MLLLHKAVVVCEYIAACQLSLNEPLGQVVRMVSFLYNRLNTISVCSHIIRVTPFLETGNWKTDTASFVKYIHL